MHRISAFFHRRQNDGTHYDVDDDSLSSSYSGESSDGSFRNPPRLMRSPGIRGLRNTDYVDPSRFSLSDGADHSSKSAFSASNMASTSPSVSRLGSPLPSPPRSPVLASRAPSLWPLPSPREFPNKGEVTERHSHRFLLDNFDTDNELSIEGETHKQPSHSSMSTENFLRHSPPLGLPVSHALRTGGKAHGDSGVDIHAYPITKQWSSPSEWISSSLQSSEGLNSQTEPCHGTFDQAFCGDRIATDEFSAAEYERTPKRRLQNGLVSKTIGYPSQDSQAIGSSNPSPPLSPSSSRAVSPGGWIKGHLLGSGAFGRVYKGIHSGTGEFCAIKEVEFVQGDHRSRESSEQLKKEITSLSSLRHPNIVQYKGSELVGDNLYIYLELISGGSLYKLCEEFKKLEEPIIRRYTRQILLGLIYLHGRKFVHRDIKGANILVDQDGTIKLADFGVSKYIKEQGEPFSLKGSPHWMAPEVIMSTTNTGYEYAVDIWSLGCTVIEMFVGRPPWCDLEPAAAMFKITKVGAPPIPDTLSAEGKSFVRLCLQKHPADRPTAVALFEHPFVKIKNETHHNVVHVSDAMNYLLEDGKVSPASSFSSALVGARPLSAPSSPRSSYMPINDFSYIQGGQRYHRGDDRNTNMGSRNPMNDSVPLQRRFGNLKESVPPTGQSRVSQTQTRPCLSAPGSPKSSPMHGFLYPSLFGDN